MDTSSNGKKGNNYVGREHRGEKWTTVKHLTGIQLKGTMQREMVLDRVVLVDDLVLPFRAILHLHAPVHFGIRHNGIFNEYYIT